MGSFTGLVALLVCGSDPAPVSAPVAGPGSRITCEVRMMTLEGLDWRSAAYARMKPAARQGTATIWTADRDLKATLEAASGGTTTTIKAPKVTTFGQQVALVNSDDTFCYIRHLDRVSDGPINKGTKLALVPEVGTIREGFSAQFSGRKLDQGVLTQVKFAESHVGSVHNVFLTEQVAPASSPVSGSSSPTAITRQIVQTIFPSKPTSMVGCIKVPEVFASQVEGEWFVPDDEILLISMGVNTVANAEGKAVVQERLAILDFAPNNSDESDTQTASTPACRVDPDPSVAQVGLDKLTMPTVPNRSCPEAVDSDGKVFELPPLPEAYAAVDLNQIEPGSPMASPQTAIAARSPKSIADPQLARTSLEAIPDHEIEANAPYLETRPFQPSALGSVIESFLRQGMGNQTDSNPGLFPNLPNPSMIDVVPETQEPFTNRSISDIKPEDHQAPGSQLVFGIGASSFSVPKRDVTAPKLPVERCDTPDCPAAGCPFSAEGCPEAKLKPGMTLSKIEMGVSVRDDKGLCVFNSEQDLVAALKNPGKTEVKYISLGGNLSLEIQAKVVAQPEAEVITAPQAPTLDRSKSWKALAEKTHSIKN